MNRDDALRMLGIIGDEDPENIRKRYRDLIRRHHPDTAGSADAHLEKTQMLTQAYRLLKAEGYLTAARQQAEWGIRENKAAFVRRALFMEDELCGTAMLVDTGICGRYCWDPEMESFSLFLRSIHAAVQRVLSRYPDAGDDRQLSQIRVKLLHLLIQQFVDPYETIRTSGFVKQVEGHPSRYRVPCHVKSAESHSDKEQQGTEYPVRVRGNNLVADLGNGESVISFTENELYYIITPMILQGAAEGVLRPEDGAVRKSRNDYRSCELYITVDESRGWDPTEKINEEIRRMLADL